MKYKSPLDMLYHWESSKPDKIYLRQPINDVWKTWTWKQAGEEVRRMATALKAMDFPPGSNIALVSKNCAHWIMCDLAIMMAGHVTVPLYPNLNKNTLRQILEHSKAKLLFVGKLDDWESMKPGVPEGMKCISFPFYPQPEYENWKDVIEAHPPVLTNAKRNAEELATIIYTSGTTSLPKGVMHKFHNLSFVTLHAMPHLGISESDKYFSYLPLAHIAERLLVEMGSIYFGGEVSFAESIEKFPKNLVETEPTVFLAVPRIWAKFQQGILEKIPQKRLSMLLKIPFVSSLVKKKIKKGLGLSHAKNIFSGAAPMPVSLLHWFDAIDIKIQEAYAATESCCYSHANLYNDIKIGQVGKPFPYCEVKLGQDNEILIKHEGITDGYYAEPEMTRALFTPDGFMHTADEGSIDANGYLKITGRIKDNFKTSKGEFVAPSPIEMNLSANSDIGQICVVGTGLPQPIALVILSENGKKKTKGGVTSELENSLQLLNPSLNQHEQIRKIVVVRSDWTVENGMLTPTLKLKRNEVEKKYVTNYERWYNENEEIFWEP